MTNKKTVMPIIVLVSICVAVAALLAAVNMLAAPKIEENAIKNEQQALFEVLSSETDGFEALKDLEGLPETVTAVYKAKGGAGYVVSLVTSTSYSSGNMAFVVGIDNNGSITGVKLNSYYESKDFGRQSYPESFVGKNIEDYNGVPLVSGVTYSSGAFKSAIGDAFVAVGIATGTEVEKPDESPEAPAPEEPEEVLPRSDEDIKALFGEMANSPLSLSPIDISSIGKSEVKRVYKDEGGKGYFAYVLTSTEWVPIETEGIVHINNDGDVEDIRLLTWTVGHGVDYTEEYINSFKGKDIWHEDGVVLVSEATRTAENFRNAIFSAIKIASNDMPRTEKKILEIAAGLIQNEKGFEKVETGKDVSPTVRALYKETSGKGYVAYLVTSTQWVQRETESVVFIDSFGTVRGIKILTWTVGHGVDYTEDFVTSFIGKSSDDIGELELVSAATGTSEHLRDAVGAALALAKPSLPIWRIISITAVLGLISAFILVLIFNRRRRAPYEKQ